MNRKIRENKEVIDELKSIIALSVDDIDIEIDERRYVNKWDLLNDVRKRLSIINTHCNITFPVPERNFVHYSVNSFGYTYVYINNMSDINDLDRIQDQLMQIVDKTTKKWVLSFSDFTLNIDLFTNIMLMFVKPNTNIEIISNIREKKVFAIEYSKINIYETGKEYTCNKHIELDEIVYIEKQYYKYMYVVLSIPNLIYLTYHFNESYTLRFLVACEHEEIKTYRIFLPVDKIPSFTNYIIMDPRKHIDSKYWAFS
jgi:hypothetical protein